MLAQWLASLMKRSSIPAIRDNPSIIPPNFGKEAYLF